MLNEKNLHAILRLRAEFGISVDIVLLFSKPKAIGMASPLYAGDSCTEICGAEFYYYSHPE